MLFVNLVGQHIHDIIWHDNIQDHKCFVLIKVSLGANMALLSP
uniref:Uncharacterized protein n=1 Tax=Setaria italica TaxID=4555 RepID=K4ANG9_SETIT